MSLRFANFQYVRHSALSAEEQDEDDPYADFKVPDDLMW